MKTSYASLALTSAALGIALFVPGSIALDSGKLIMAGILTLTMLVLNIIAFIQFKRIRKNKE